MTLPLWWYFVVSVIVAGAVWLAYTEGRARGHEAPNPEAYRKGWEAGCAHGETKQRRDLLYAAEPVLDRFPTSLGARAMFRALGGTVPPLRRTKAPRIVSTEDSGDVRPLDVGSLPVQPSAFGRLSAAPDHGEGEE